MPYCGGDKSCIMRSLSFNVMVKDETLPFRKYSSFVEQ